MIEVKLNNQALSHEIFEFLRILFPSYERENFMIATINNDVFTIQSDECIINIQIKESENLQRFLKKSIIEELTKNNYKTPEWGVLHGIRPLKLTYELIQDNGHLKAAEILKNEYLISNNKIELMFETIANQSNIIFENKDNYSIYVHIPFCPTKCTYCSFHTLSSNSGFIDEYVETLINDIRREAPLLNKNPSSIYIGGGTPTSIGVKNLERIIVELKKNFGETREFTVEAGRVDTFDTNMQDMLHMYNVDRVSINPQSMNEKTINAINRSSSVRELIKCYESAKNKFKDINMDLILGLYGETDKDFLNSLNEVIKLHPTNITVHSLALKNNSMYFNNNITSTISENIVDTIVSKLKNNDYYPYYLYRQKRIIGGNENIGYSLKGHESIYNIMMIQEMQDIGGFGMSATSKIHYDKDKFIQIANFRNMHEYLSRNEEIYNKKLNALQKKGK